ncbi:hypothetical protein FN846DRAFT_777460 [Sphaerosporella brunnea]|uniref:Uncharacterized protein n=1 Tax=Sphaerosporella brunnea TaxID=1250544 RepID=A0A5J5EZ35_9PEZI|nr:hypothetical protein FN846DRAFT_777460 [Sphaerosporella brunnea]
MQITPREREHRLIVDWRKPLQRYDTSHFQHLRSVDWSKTAYGSSASWPPLLRSIAMAMMQNHTPMILHWGPNYDIMYNEEYAKIARDKHPALLGAPLSEWPEVSDFFRPFLDAAYYGGQTTGDVGRRYAKLLLTHRGQSGALEEGYFDFTLLPILQSSGLTDGVLEIAIDRTRVVLAYRRMDTLGKLSNSLRTIHDFNDEFWRSVVAAFDENPMDSPVLILYRTASDSHQSVHQLQEAIGATPGGNFAPYVYSDGAPAGIFKEDMRIAKERNKVVLKQLSVEVTNSGELNSRGIGSNPSAAAIIPIQVAGKATYGFLILGINPLRPMERSYKLWLDCIRKELSAAAVGVWSRQQEISRILEREQSGSLKQVIFDLKSQLGQCTQAQKRSELLFTQTSETLPVGLMLLDLGGQVFFSNHMAKKMFRASCDKELNQTWRDHIYHEDRDKVLEAFSHAVQHKQNMFMHHRLGNCEPERGWNYWVASSMVAQVDEFTGQISRYVFSLQDISSHKQNEEYQRHLSDQANERRHQLETFLDMFSHELRNPFSATLQCADSILNSLSLLENKGQPLKTDDMMEYAQTILFCVQHQMRIIDDVLTVSKLEAMALTLTPVNVRLHEALWQILKIFRSQLQTKNLRASCIVEDSYKDLHVDWVEADPSRWSQILVNLIGNAIKFSGPDNDEREITIRLGASKERPTGYGDVSYRIDEQEETELQDDASEYIDQLGSGEHIYIQAMVEDKGIGISPKWKKRLFHRFEQVPKTHINYGGSGLGLFICRRLCRIQGGEIGFSSEEGKGSRFAFFIRVRRLNTAEESLHHYPTIGDVAAARTNPTTDVAPAVSASQAASRMPEYTECLPVYRVLVVEDNLLNQKVVQRQLNRLGCVTYVASNGEQAVEFVKKSKYGAAMGEDWPSLDIVLMDMEMPVMDGCTATRKIREMERTGELVKHVPILGISANARPEQVALMTEAGMDDAIPKPFTVPTLLQRFSQLMEKFSISVETLPPLAPKENVESKQKPRRPSMLKDLSRTGSIFRRSSEEQLSYQVTRL